MYFEFFGLSRPPFKITPDTDVFFEGGNRGAILEALIYAITHGEGIIKVTGEVGSGKFGGRGCIGHGSRCRSGVRWATIGVRVPQFDPIVQPRR